MRFLPSRKTSARRLLSLAAALGLATGAAFVPCGNASEEWNQQMKNLARPLHDVADLDPLIEAAGDRRLVLLGEATHGTHEFYRWRDLISRRLIEEKGFSFIAVEGDWAAIQRLNRYVRGETEGESSAREVVATFERWPSWMWANEEFVELAEWLRSFNLALPAERRVGLHGLDLYGPWESMREVIGFFEAATGEQVAEQVRQHYAEWARYTENGHRYARAVHAFLPSAEEGVRKVVEKLRQRRPDSESDEMAAWFEAKQNAKVVKNAELHFRSMTEPGSHSWNARASHMKRAAGRLLDFYGPGSRGIVWAHNTHVGDARATIMAAHGQVNIGHLARESLGDEHVFIAGFSTWKGWVGAGTAWGSTPEVMPVPAAPDDSVEGRLRQILDGDGWFLFDEQARDPTLEFALGHRAIGVTYNPETDNPGNYVPTLLSRRYDALLFFQETTALTPVD